MSSEITIKLNRETYKKLQQIKMVIDADTIADVITEMTDKYGEQFKQTKLIQAMKGKNGNSNRT